MKVAPILDQPGRDDIATVVRVLTAIPRIAAWIVGAVIGSLVAGFVQGWRDAA